MAKIPVKFYKLEELPEEPQANTFYFIENEDIAESYLTDAEGIPKQVGNSDMINALIAEANLTQAQVTGLIDDLAAKQDLITTYNADKPSSPAHTLDDDFLGNTLGNDWSLLNLHPSNLAVSHSLLQITQSISTSGEISGIEQPLPSGVFSIVAKVSNNNKNTPTNAGLYLYKTPDFNENHRYLLSVDAAEVRLTIFDGNLLSENLASIGIDRLYDQNNWFYLKMFKVDNSTWDFYFSVDGVEWIGVALGESINAEKCGLGLRGDADKTGYFDWIRVYDGGNIAIIGG